MVQSSKFMAYIAMIGREIERADLTYWFLQLAL